jgi:two-component system invasion response regulator UvrY
MYADASLVRRMLEAGAGGYVLKNATPAQLKEAVRKVAAGGRWFSAGLGVDDGLDGCDPAEVLSRRERQVLASIARGRKTGETADELGLSPKTVETYRRRLMQKLDIETVAGLVVYALKTGIVGLDVFAELN